MAKFKPNFWTFLGRLGTAYKYLLYGAGGREDFEPKRRRKRGTHLQQKARYEFGAASRMAAPLRQALSSCPAQWFDQTLSARLSGQLYKLIRASGGATGPGCLERGQLAMLQGFPFNVGKAQQAFFCPQTPAVQVRTHPPGVVLRAEVGFLEELFGRRLRDYHRVGLGLLALSEMRFDEERKAYAYSDAQWHGQMAYGESPERSQWGGEELILEVEMDCDGGVPVGVVGFVPFMGLI